MFAAVERWRQARAQRRERLFRYWNGTRWAYADPWSLARKIYGGGFDVESRLPAVQEGKEPQTSEVLEWLCGVFGLTRFDGQTGLTDSQVLDVFGAFSEYLDDVKKNISPGPTLPPPTESLSSISLVDQGATPGHCSDCG